MWCWTGILASYSHFLLHRGSSHVAAGLLSVKMQNKMKVGAPVASEKWCSQWRDNVQPLITLYEDPRIFCFSKGTHLYELWRTQNPSFQLQWCYIEPHKAEIKYKDGEQKRPSVAVKSGECYRDSLTVMKVGPLNLCSVPPALCDHCVLMQPNTNTVPIISMFFSVSGVRQQSEKEM